MTKTTAKKQQEQAAATAAAKKKRQDQAAAAAVTYVSTNAQLCSLRPPASATDAPNRVVGLHFRVASGADAATAPFATIAVAMGTRATVLRLVPALSKSRVQEELAALLADASVTKVLCGVAATAQRLQSWFGASRVVIRNVIDLELSREHAQLKRDLIVEAFANQCHDVANAHYDAAQAHVKKDPKAWSQPLLARPLVLYVANQAAMCLAWHAHVARAAAAAAQASGGDGGGVVTELAACTARRWQSAVDKMQQRAPPPAPAPVAAHTHGPTASTATSAPAPAPAPVGMVDTPPPPMTASTASESDALVYIHTTQALHALMERRGAQLFRSAETPAVALHFHMQSDSSSSSASGAAALVAVTMTGSSVLPAAAGAGAEAETDSDADASDRTESQRDTVVLHLLPTLDRALVASVVMRVLEDAAIVKVTHAVHAPAFALRALAAAPTEPVQCVDLQLAFEHAVDSRVRGADLERIATHCAVPFAKATYREALASRPLSALDVLSKPLLRSLRLATHMLLDCYAKLLAPAPSLPARADAPATVMRMTARRWRLAIANGGVPSIWFDASDDYAARSLECLDASYEAVVPPLRLQCDLEPLLALLPPKYCAPIRAIDGYHDKLVDICLDVGRRAHVYVGKGQRIALCATRASPSVGSSTSSSGSSRDEDSAELDAGSAATATAPPATTVTKGDIGDVLARLGGPHKIGFDNRAGIDKQLHRISVMRSKTGELYGLTMRVGRALEHAANVLQDVLMSSAHRDKSVLLLGRPGSGKTTLIRDIARSIAATGENVCIIDTSNEIGGDGLVPHECVGWARRMMVPALEQQASVMIECVQNHTVETLVIDEIGRKAEVLAASTVRQRGPRIIASGHGDLRSLMKNPDLKGLVGGVQQVMVGDAAAAKTAHKSKLQHERAGAPIFDIIVELDHVDRGRCRIVWDVGDAVDAVLRGERDYASELRKQDVHVVGILQRQS